MPERVAIVGSRDYPDEPEVSSYVLSLPAGTVVVSGGARGVEPTDELTDLFPGSGAVGRAWEAWRAQARLVLPDEPLDAPASLFGEAL